MGGDPRRNVHDEKMSVHSYEQFVGIFDNVLDHVRDVRCDDRPNGNDKNVAKRIRKWLFAEELCDQDMATHTFLQECFPSEGSCSLAVARCTGCSTCGVETSGSRLGPDWFNTKVQQEEVISLNECRSDR